MESSNYDEAFKKFSHWVESNENQLKTACYCCPRQTNPTINESDDTSTNTKPPPNPDPKKWTSVIEYHREFQQKIEDLGYQHSGDIKRFLDEDESITDEQKLEIETLEERWHRMWIKSLEQLVVVEKGPCCPNHKSSVTTKPSFNSTLNYRRPIHTNRVRPLSYPNCNEALDWDYRHTLSLTGCHQENGSQIDLDSVDEQETKKLTYFGENYEVWFCKEEENIVHSRPPSVEPPERPELAKAVVTSDSNMNGDGNFNLLMLTAPSSILSIDGSKWTHSKRRSSFFWRYLAAIIFVIILILFSSIYHEPHQMHRSYYSTQPPV